MNCIEFSFSGVYREEGFTVPGGAVVNMEDLEGVQCYCSAPEEILGRIPENLPFIRFIDSGDYHYMTALLASRETQPFHLLLLDNHRDDGEAAFEGLLSCGDWVRRMRETCGMLGDVLTIGPKGCPGEVPECWGKERRGERLYVSLDKDILSREFARTNWDQGEFTLERVFEIIGKLAGEMRLVAVDICGELTGAKGGHAQDFEINRITNNRLLEFMEDIQSRELQKTCLYESHVELGAKMSPFAGFMMPIQYTSITQEHNAVRNNLGMFDVSHMGEIFVSGPGAEAFVNHIFTNEIRGFAPGKVLYGMMCLPGGGTVDDLLVYREFTKDHFLLVVNASNIDKDYAWLKENAKGFDCKVENASPLWGQIALQGPSAEKCLLELFGWQEASSLEFYTFCDLEYNGERLILSRTGYTGEDGFEIYTTRENTVQIWNRFLEAGVPPCGLGCRDTLRFEAGLPLYGDELSEDISPVMAGLGMFCKFDKEFIGRDALLSQKEGAVEKKLVGIEIEDKAIPRAGYPVETPDGEEVGTVTTGYHSITLDKSICFALVKKDYAPLGTPLQIRIRKKVFPGKVIGKRFYKTNYKK